MVFLFTSKIRSREAELHLIYNTHEKLVKEKHLIVKEKKSLTQLKSWMLNLNIFLLNSTEQWGRIQFTGEIKKYVKL